MRRIMLGSVVALAMLGAACSDGDDDDASSGEGSGERQEYVEAIGSLLGAMGLPAEETECTADVYVDAVGFDQLKEAATPAEIRDNPNITPAELWGDIDEADADAFYEGMNACFDVREFFTSMLSGGDPAVGECLAEEIDDDMFKQVIVNGLLGETAAGAAEVVDTAMENAYSQCASGVPGAGEPPVDTSVP